jgi:proteasome lid subunit RPN8/RPN11
MNGKPVIIYRSVIEKIFQEACDYLGRTADGSLGLEISGLLLGRSDGERILINDYAVGGRGESSYYTEIDESIIADLARKISLGEKERIYGWFHSHPGIGLFLSPIDQRTLRNMQRLSPDAFALVIDPLHSKRFKYFRYDLKRSRSYEIEVSYIDR